MMKKRKIVKINLFLHEAGAEDLDILEDAELPVDQSATDLAEETTGEAGIPDETAGPITEGSGNEIKVTAAILPQVDGMQVNDEFDSITTYRVKAINGDEVTLEPIDYLPTEDVVLDEPGLEEGLGAEAGLPAPTVPGAEGVPPEGGGLAGLL